MLNVKTTVENGTATIYVYDDAVLIGALTNSFSTNTEAFGWLARRGVNSVDNFMTFIYYALTKGSFGTKVYDLLNKYSYFTLNGVTGLYKVDYKTEVACTTHLERALNVQTSVENGTATIYVYNRTTLIGRLTKSFASNEEAIDWLSLRGVTSVDNFMTFVYYSLAKGVLGTKVLEMLNQYGYFSLNGVVGFYQANHITCEFGMTNRQYYCA